jgi:hypothetical protein
MKVRQIPAVLIAFAVASWLGAILELGAAATGEGSSLRSPSESYSAAR